VSDQFTIDVSQLKAFVKKFGEQATPIVTSNLRLALDDALGYIENQVIDRTPVNYGTLRGSIYTEVFGVSADAVRGVELSGVVSSSDFEPKVWAMEQGRAKGKMPPIEAIALWVKRKGLAQDERAIKRIAFLIARSIGRGTSRHQQHPSKMFETAAAASEACVQKTFDDSVNDVLKQWSAL
jgi:hypothetical protein